MLVKPLKKYSTKYKNNIIEGPISGYFWMEAIIKSKNMKNQKSNYWIWIN